MCEDMAQSLTPNMGLVKTRLFFIIISDMDHPEDVFLLKDFSD